MACRLYYVKHILWIDFSHHTGYNGEDKGKDWVEKVLGWTVEVVRHSRKITPYRAEILSGLKTPLVLLILPG